LRWRQTCFLERSSCFCKKKKKKKKKNFNQSQSDESEQEESESDKEGGEDDPFANCQQRVMTKKPIVGKVPEEKKET